MGQNQSKIALASGDDAEYKAYKASEGQEKGTWKGMPSHKVVKEKATFKGTNLRITMLTCDDGKGGTFDHMVLMTPKEYADLKRKGMSSFPPSCTYHPGKDDDNLMRLKNIALQELDTHPHVREERKVYTHCTKNARRAGAWA